MKTKTLLCKLNFNGTCANPKPKGFKVYIYGKVSPPSLLRAWHRLDKLRNENLETSCELFKKFGKGYIALYIAEGQSLLAATIQMENEIDGIDRLGADIFDKKDEPAARWLTSKLLVSAKIQPGYIA